MLFLDQTQKHIAELTLAGSTTAEEWVQVLKRRDRETEDHSQRVVQMTVKLARWLGIEGTRLEHVYYGALLHDIGKIYIPDSVLLKPGPLTDLEWEIMRQHPIYAAHLLKPICDLRPALSIPYCHHEKWDGSGYPRRLKGEEIPLEARIFTVVDVWDALTNNRVYRSAWTEEEALRYIYQQSEKHFDPKVVISFLEIMNTTPFL
jgi:HD-GYP domain-containing protein (c-di-GMP phosphodiesterase class II)